MGIDSICTAVIPIAGRGSRLLPVTKVIRKELLPIGRKPLIQYAIEEAHASGIRNIIFVCHPNDPSPLSYFERNLQLENYLQAHGRSEEVELLANIGNDLHFTVILQRNYLGLADAINRAKELVADSTFAVMLPDALMIAEAGQMPCMEQLINCFSEKKGPVLAIRQILPEETKNFGIIDIATNWEKQGNPYPAIRSLIEKPTIDQAPSLYGVFGRYVLTPDIFPVIAKLQPGQSGELQLTDALNLYCKNNPLYGCFFENIHYDVGNWKGYEEATKYFLEVHENKELALQKQSICLRPY